MANPETIITSIRRRCTDVFEACQANLDAVEQDRDDFIAEKGVDFFSTWFAEVQGYDITMQEMVDAVNAMGDLQTAFEAVRSKLQIVRLR